MKRFVYVFCSLCVIFCTVFYTSASEWDWADGFFDVDENFQGEDYVTTSQVLESKEDYKTIIKSNDIPILRSSSANTSHSPLDIPFYKLQSDIPYMYDIVQGIFSGENRELTCLMSINSSNASLFICQYGVPCTWDSRSNSSTSSIQRVAYGMVVPRGMDGFTPTYYLLRYTFSSDTFSLFNVSESQSSVFGWNFNNNSLPLSNDNPKFFSIFSNTITNFLNNTRDLYFFGYPFNYGDIITSPSTSFDTEYYLLHNTNVNQWAGQVIHTDLRGSFSCGNALAYFPSDSQLTSGNAFLYNNDFSFSDFQFNEPAETYDGDFSGIDAALIRFTSDTNSFITRINQSKSRVTGYISDFFNVFDVDHIPRPLYFIILFLVICAVLVGVFA